MEDDAFHVRTLAYPAKGCRASTTTGASAGRPASPPPVRPAEVAGPSTPAGVLAPAFGLVRCPQVEASLNESLPLYGGAPQHSHPAVGRPQDMGIGTIKRPAAADSAVGSTRRIGRCLNYVWSLPLLGGLRVPRAESRRMAPSAAAWRCGASRWLRASGSSGPEPGLRIRSQAYLVGNVGGKAGSGASALPVGNGLTRR